MTAKLWNTSVTAIQSLNEAPSWLKEQTCLSFGEAMKLPALDVAANGQDAIPSVEEKLLEPDYLEFLLEQIKLEPRGPEWTVILKERLVALEPFVNKRVITAMFWRKPNSVTLRIDPETGELFHFEVS